MNSMKTSLTSCLAKQRCIDFSASNMAERSATIAPSDEFYNPLLCKWSFDPAIMTTFESMFTTLCTLIASPTACPRSRLGAVSKICLDKIGSGACKDNQSWPVSRSFPFFISKGSCSANSVSPFSDSRCPYLLSSPSTELP